MAETTFPQRPVVIEHRVTRPLRVPSRYTVRYWIESDPDHGGVRFVDEHVQEAIGLAEASIGEGWLPDEIAVHLLAQLKWANSVEVCDKNGIGTAVHRDWP